MDVENGGVRLLDLPDEVGQEVKDEVERVRQEIVDGRVTVSAVSDAEEMKRRVEELFPA
jgi:basic membrane lipoprotein Med (substrate-binding protein (PBP1-ABC) superfamily)